MTTSYSAILLVHLSDSKAKLRRDAYLCLTPMGDVMTAATPAPVTPQVLPWLEPTLVLRTVIICGRNLRRT
jgi:hypothetical protein